MNSVLNIALASMLVVIISACTPVQPVKQAFVDLGPTPSTWQANSSVAVSEKTLESDLHALTRTWGLSLPEPLNLLLDQVASENLQAQISRLNLQRAALDLSISSRQRLPSASFSLSDRHSESEGDQGKEWGHTHHAGVSVSWPLDLWRSLADGVKQKGALYHAKEFEFLALKQSLQAQVITLYLSISELDQLLILSEKNIENQKRRLQMSLTRLDYGLAVSVDIRNARTNLLRLRESRKQLESRKGSALRQLNVLLGQYPDTGYTGADNLTFNLLELAPLIELSTPQHIVLNRPDIRQAESELIASGFSWNIAKKNRLPKLNLSLASGHQSDTLSDIFNIDYWLSSVVSSLVQPVFYRGVLSVEQEKARLQHQIAINQYKSALLEAWQEVENAIENESFIIERLAFLKRALTEATLAEEQVELLYNTGLATSFELLAAQRTRTSIESSLVNLTVSQLKNRVQLQLALGLPAVERT